jgi:NPCBM/NEW2 domain
MNRFSARPSSLAFALALAILPAGVRAEVAGPPTFTVLAADGKSVQGALRELGPDWSIRVGDDARIDGGEVLTVRRAGLPLPPPPTRGQLLLAGGDAIPVEKPLLIGERLHFRCLPLAKSEDASVPLSAVSVIWYTAANGENPERLRRRLVQETHKRDLVLLTNGDVLEGVLTGLDEKIVTMELERKPVTAAVERIAAIAMSSELTEAPRPKGAYGRIILAATGDAADGARLSLATARCADGETLTGLTLFGAALSVPLAKVAALDLFQGKAIYVSDLKSSRYENLPYLDDRWQYTRDSGTTGLDLRLAGSTYDKGVGLHSHSRLTYAVPAGYHRFEALVGLDDRTGKQGSVRIRALADGKPLDLGTDAELTAVGGPRAIRVDLAGAKELTLEVDFGKGGPVQDHVDWVDARFVK